jgi:hypothetical protein
MANYKRCHVCIDLAIKVTCYCNNMPPILPIPVFKSKPNKYWKINMLEQNKVLMPKKQKVSNMYQIALSKDTTQKLYEKAISKMKVGSYSDPTLGDQACQIRAFALKQILTTSSMTKVDRKSEVEQLTESMEKASLREVDPKNFLINMEMMQVCTETEFDKNGMVILDKSTDNPFIKNAQNFDNTYTIVSYTDKKISQGDKRILEADLILSIRKELVEDSLIKLLESLRESSVEGKKTIVKELIESQKYMVRKCCNNTVFLPILPLFASFYSIMKYELATASPIILKLSLFEKVEQGVKFKGAEALLCMPNEKQDDYIIVNQVDEVTASNSLKPLITCEVFAISDKSAEKSALNVSSMEEYIKGLKKFSLLNLCLSIAAKHPQYPKLVQNSKEKVDDMQVESKASYELEGSTSYFAKEFQYYKSLPLGKSLTFYDKTAEGIKVTSQSTDFTVTHIYTSTLQYEREKVISVEKSIN